MRILAIDLKKRREIADIKAVSGRAKNTWVRCDAISVRQASSAAVHRDSGNEWAAGVAGARFAGSLRGKS
jgi:hypothetical protein